MKTNSGFIFIIFCSLAMGFLIVSQSLSQDRTTKQIEIDSNIQEQLQGIIKEKRNENEVARVKLEEIISSWGNLNNLIERKVAREILETQLENMETTAMDIYRTSNNNIEAINQVRTELSMVVPEIRDEKAIPEKTLDTKPRSWSEIVQDQSKKGTNQQVQAMLQANQYMTLQLQDSLYGLSGFLNQLDEDFGELEAAREEQKEEEAERLTESIKSKTEEAKEQIKLMLKVIKEIKERQEQAIQAIRM
jgi:hypothetical protein